jgi:hypothetical protein
MAFAAQDRGAVRAFFGTGAAVLHEPRLWHEYHDGYGAFGRDPGRQQRRGRLPRARAADVITDGFESRH